MGYSIDIALTFAGSTHDRQTRQTDTTHAAHATHASITRHFLWELPRCITRGEAEGGRAVQSLILVCGGDVSTVN